MAGIEKLPPCQEMAGEAGFFDQRKHALAVGIPADAGWRRRKHLPAHRQCALRVALGVDGMADSCRGRCTGSPPSTPGATRRAHWRCAGKCCAAPPTGIGWNPYRQRMFALVEEACFASHLLAWRQFLNSGHERALILEDDAEPFPGFGEAMRELLADRQPIDIIKFEGTYRKGSRLAIPVRDLGPARAGALARPVPAGLPTC